VDSKNYHISIDDLSNAFIITYKAGALGDFFSSIFLFNWYKKFKQFLPRYGPDTFTYEPWSKRWIFRDSSEGKFRDIISKTASPSVDHCHLAHIISNCVHSNKNSQLPYIFVSENISHYGSSIQAVNNATVINISVPIEYEPVLTALSWYKIKLSSLTTKILHNVNWEQEFTYNKFTLMSSQRANKLEFNLANYMSFDIIKFLYNKDTQGLEIHMDRHLNSMVDTALRDLEEIFNYLEINIGDSKNYDYEKIYNKIKLL
jgi:hypothetical protein